MKRPLSCLVMLGLLSCGGSTVTSGGTGGGGGAAGAAGHAPSPPDSAAAGAAGVAGTPQLPDGGAGMAGTAQLPEGGAGMAGTAQLPDGSAGMAGTAQLPDGGAGMAGTAQLPDGSAGSAGTAQLPDGSAGGAGTDAGPGCAATATLDSTFAQLATSVCASYAHCCTAVGSTVDASCEAVAAARLHSAYDPSICLGATLIPDGVTRFMDAFDHYFASCTNPQDVYEEMVHATWSLFDGPQQPGEICHGAADCHQPPVGWATCVFPSGPDGFCRSEPTVNLGEACGGPSNATLRPQCAAGLSCTNGTCQPFAPIGASCATATCVAEAHCDTGQCVAWLADGADCSGAPFNCGPGSTCDLFTRTCTALGTVGASCSSSSECASAICAGGLCMPDNGLLGAKCQ